MKRPCARTWRSSSPPCRPAGTDGGGRDCTEGPAAPGRRNADPPDAEGRSRCPKPDGADRTCGFYGPALPAGRGADILGAEERRELHPRSLAVPGDDELNRLISHYSVLELAYSDQAATDRDQQVNLEKTTSDCVHLIKNQGSEKTIKDITKALKEAEERGDWTEHRRLLETQRDLSRRPGRRIPGRGPSGSS